MKLVPPIRPTGTVTKKRLSSTQGENIVLIIQPAVSYISFQIIITKPMSQTKEQIEQELQSFKDANFDWRSVEWKANTVTGFNNRLATFTGNYIL